MSKARWLTGSLVGVALVAGSVSPAQARPRYGYGGWGGDRWHHRHGDGFGVGDAIGVAALVGAVAIVASSMAKDRKASRPSSPYDGRPYGDRSEDRNAPYDAPPPSAGTDYGADHPTDRRDDDFSDVAAVEPQDNARMTDACAMAARNEAQAQGGYAEVRHIDTPRATTGGYNIDGEVETRTSWSASDGATRRFTCSMRDGRVAEVYLSRDMAAR